MSVYIKHTVFISAILSLCSLAPAFGLLTSAELAKTYTPKLKSAYPLRPFQRKLAPTHQFSRPIASKRFSSNTFHFSGTSKTTDHSRTEFTRRPFSSRSYSTPTGSTTTVAKHLLRRLKEANVEHFFGVPAQSCAGFFQEASKTNSFQSIITTNELEAGYIGDAYARFRGLGAVCSSYGVGTFSMLNATAGSFVEKVPVVVINGGPTQRDIERERNKGVIFTHSTGRPQSDLNVFKTVTAKAKIIDNPQNAADIIDDLILTAQINMEPVYLEVPSDMWDSECASPEGPLKLPIPVYTPDSVNAIATETVNRLKTASNPTLLLGVEVARKGLTQPILDLVQKSRFRFSTTLLTKSIIPETNPKFVGTYDSDLAPKPVRKEVEDSDLLVALGCQYGIDHAYLVEKQFEKMIHVAFNKGRIGSRHFEGTDLSAFLSKLNTLVDGPSVTSNLSKAPNGRWEVAPNFNDSDLVTHENLFSTLQAFINQNHVTVLDTCLSSYPGADLRINHANGYLANPVWLSIGYGAGAAAGVHFATGKRPIVVVGDGGFQMIAQTYSTLIKYKVPAIILVINNALYGIEQFLIDPDFYLKENHPHLDYCELHPWNYEKFPKVFNGGLGYKANTVGELKTAFGAVSTIKDKPTIISLPISSKDLPKENWEYLRRQ